MKISYESDFIEFNAIYWGNHESHQFHLDHWLHFELTCEVHLAMLNRSKVLTLFCKIQSVWSRSGRKLLWKHLYLQSRDVGNWFREDLRSRKLGFAQKKWPPDPRVHHHFPHQNFHYIPFLHKQSPHHHYYYYYYHHHHHHHHHVIVILVGFRLGTGWSPVEDPQVLDSMAVQYHLDIAYK